MYSWDGLFGKLLLHYFNLFPQVDGSVGASDSWGLETDLMPRDFAYFHILYYITFLADALEGARSALYNALGYSDDP